MSFAAEQYGLVAEKYSVALVHGSAVAMPVGLSASKKPYGIVICEADLGARSINGLSYTLDGNLVPQVTITLDSAATVNCVVAILYQR